MRRDDKREHRENKRIIKRAGHKHVRNTVKRVLTENPDEAAHLEHDFGRYRSIEMNGIDNIAKPRRMAFVGDPELDTQSD